MMEEKGVIHSTDLYMIGVEYLGGSYKYVHWDEDLDRLRITDVTRADFFNIDDAIEFKKRAENAKFVAYGVGLDSEVTEYREAYDSAEYNVKLVNVKSASLFEVKLHEDVKIERELKVRAEMQKYVDSLTQEQYSALEWIFNKDD